MGGCCANMGQSSSTDKRDELDKRLAKARQLRILSSSILGRRRTQEDRHLVIESLPEHPEIALFAVFDGHNGDGCADFCYQNVVDIISSRIKKGFITPSALRDAFITLDDVFLNGSPDTPLDSGCTAVIAVYNRITGQFIVGNCGDARCISSKSGVAQAYTVDHKPEVTTEKKRIESSGRRVVDNRLDGVLAVSRALGDLSLKRVHLKYDAAGRIKRNASDPETWALTCVPYIHEGTLSRDHSFFVLACDGLFDVMSNQDVVDWISARLKMERDNNVNAAHHEAQKLAFAALSDSSSSLKPEQLSPSDTKDAVDTKVISTSSSELLSNAQSGSSDFEGPFDYEDEDDEGAEDAPTDADGENNMSMRRRRNAPAGALEAVNEEANAQSEDNNADPSSRNVASDENKASDANNSPLSAEDEEKQKERIKARQDRAAARAAAARAVQQTLQNKRVQRKKKTTQQIKLDEMEKKRQKMQTLSHRIHVYRSSDTEPVVPSEDPANSNEIKNMAQDLAEYAVKKGSMDNISIIVICLEKPGKHNMSASSSNLLSSSSNLHAHTTSALHLNTGPETPRKDVLASSVSSPHLRPLEAEKNQLRLPPKALEAAVASGNSGGPLTPKEKKELRQKQWDQQLKNDVTSNEQASGASANSSRPNNATPTLEPSGKTEAVPPAAIEAAT